MYSEFPYYEAPKSKRLGVWQKAFEEYLDDRKKNWHKRAHMASINTWRKFLRSTGKTPWEIKTEDVQDFVDGLDKKGSKPRTINCHITQISSFYEWCIEMNIDPECPIGFNPARKFPRLKSVRYDSADYLTIEEIGRLLEAVKSDPSVMSIRDYAIILIRLLLGDANRHLLKIKWGDLRFEYGKTKFSYRHKGKKIERVLPHEVWQAISAYLEASGRYEHMGADDYVFVPLARPLVDGDRSQKGEWNAKKSMDGGNFNHGLREFARLAGIHEKKVTLNCLKNSAIMLYYEAGAGIRQLNDFTAWYGEKETRRIITGMERNLQKKVSSRIFESMMEVNAMKVEDKGENPAIRSREPGRRKPGEIFTHGFRREGPMPEEMMEKELAEGRVDLREEMTGLQKLIDRLFEMTVNEKNWSTQISLAEIFSASVTRLARMDKIQRDYLEIKTATWLQSLQRIAGEMMEEGEIEPEELEEFNREIENAGKEEEGMAKIFIQENLARIRVMMRQALEISETIDEPKDLAILVDKYGTIGVRLANLLAGKFGSIGDLEDLRERAIEDAYDELYMED